MAHVIIWCILLIIYLLPAAIANSRELHNKRGIFWINLCLAWIPFVWLILLFVAILARREPAATIIYVER